MHNIYLNLRYMYECMYYIHTLLLPMSEDLPGTVPVPVKVYFIYITIFGARFCFTYFGSVHLSY